MKVRIVVEDGEMYNLPETDITVNTRDTSFGEFPQDVLKEGLDEAVRRTLAAHGRAHGGHRDHSSAFDK